MKKRDTIIFVMPRLPFPASSGRKTSLYHYCRILSEELGYRLVVAAFMENGDDPHNKPDFIDKLIVLPKGSAKTKIKNIIIDSLILQKKPMQVSLYWNLKAKQVINDLVKKENPKYIIGDMVRSIDYIKDIDCFRISDLDDRISLRYQRQLDTDINGINPYGAFLKTLPKLIQKIMLFKPIKLFVVKREIKLLKKYELEMGEVCDITVFVAEKEAQEFNKELKKEKARAVPIGVDTEYFSYRKTGNENNYIGFLGALSVAHNENAVKHFVKDIMPLINNKNVDAKFLVIGGGASEELNRLSSPNIIFTGRVDDVREYLEKCKVFVCPMTFGSGIKTKNLEAMAMGLPVVTTTIGAENINAINGKDWIVADTDEGIANSIIDLLNDDEKCILIGKNGSNYILSNFTWDIAKRKFEKILNE